MRLGLMVFVLMVMGGATQAQTPAPPACDPVPYGLQTCPSDIKEFLGRVESCNHWAGEEPYDDARRKEIEKALEEDKCKALPCDYQALLREYSTRTKQRKMIEGNVEKITGSPYMNDKACVEEPKREEENFNFIN